MSSSLVSSAGVARSGRSRVRGFTLIELMICVFLVAIFAAIAVPSFSSLIEGNRVQTGAESFYRLLQSARADAVDLRTPFTLCQNGSAASWVLVKGATTCTSLSSPAQQLSLASSISLSSSLTTLPFLADGSATAGSFVFSSSKSKTAYTVKVAASGYMSMTSVTSQ